MGIKVPGTFIPGTIQNYVTESTWIKGTFVVVKTLEERNCLPKGPKVDGTTVYVVDEDREYRWLKNKWNMLPPGFFDAPQDGKLYARMDGQWVEVTIDLKPIEEDIATIKSQIAELYSITTTLSNSLSTLQNEVTSGFQSTTQSIKLINTELDKKSEIQVVDVLPSVEEANPQYVYYIPTNNGAYLQYIIVDNEWKQIGIAEGTIQEALQDYYTKPQVDGLLDNYYTKEEADKTYILRDSELQEIIGNLSINGNLFVNGTTTTVNHENITVNSAVIITNNNGADLSTTLSGLAIKTGTDNQAYGIMFSKAEDESVLLGLGTVAEDNSFSYGAGEGSPLAIRADSSELNPNHILSWDSENLKLIDSGILNSNVVTTNTAQTITANKTFSGQNTTVNYLNAENATINHPYLKDTVMIDGWRDNSGFYSRTTGIVNRGVTINYPFTEDGTFTFAVTENIPTTVSELTNDAGYITNQVSDLLNYTTTADLNELLENKQDNLTAGTNIEITDTNVINCTLPKNLVTTNTPQNITARKSFLLNEENDIGLSVAVKGYSPWLAFTPSSISQYNSVGTSSIKLVFEDVGDESNTITIPNKTGTLSLLTDIPDLDNYSGYIDVINGTAGSGIRVHDTANTSPYTKYGYDKIETYGNSNALQYTLNIPDKNGTLAITDDIPDISNLVTTDTTQIITENKGSEANYYTNGSIVVGNYSDSDLNAIVNGEDPADWDNSEVVIGHDSITLSDYYNGGTDMEYVEMSTFRPGGADGFTDYDNKVVSYRKFGIYVEKYLDDTEEKTDKYYLGFPFKSGMLAVESDIPSYTEFSGVTYSTEDGIDVAYGNNHIALPIINGDNISFAIEDNKLVISSQSDPITIDSTPTSGSSNAVSSGGVYTALQGKQNTLVSGTNIKTINGEPILGSGDITLEAPTNMMTTDTAQSITAVKNFRVARDSDQGAIIVSKEDVSIYNVYYPGIMRVYNGSLGSTTLNFSPLENESYNISVPNKNGTLALVGDLPRSITLTPTPSDDGTVGSSDLSLLRASDNNYVTLNGKLYRLSNKQSTTLSYTNTDIDSSGNLSIGTIIVTISDGAWKLYESSMASSTEISNIFEQTTTYTETYNVDSVDALPQTASAGALANVRGTYYKYEE